jgi:hypothetical protein
MWRNNRTGSSNPPRSASKSLTFAAFPDLTEKSFETARNVRALASGVNCAAKERRRGESRSGEFRGIFSGARWRSPDSVRDHQRPFARKLAARSVDTRVHRLVGINVVFGSERHRDPSSHAVPARNRQPLLPLLSPRPPSFAGRFCGSASCAMCASGASRRRPHLHVPIP